MQRIPRFLTAVAISSILLGGCAVRRAPQYPSSSLGNLSAKAIPSGDGCNLVVSGAGTDERRLAVKDTDVKQLILARLDGETRLLALTSDPEKAVRMYTLSDRGLAEVWRGVSSSLKPWKIQVGDVDGDGKVDIGVGVYKKARFHPVMAKRPFIYGWDGKDIYPKWRGSRLSRPFTDFVLADFGPPGAKIVAIEETQDQRNELAVYSWTGFGFSRDWAGAGAEKMEDLRVSGSSGEQRITVRVGAADRVYVWSGKELRIVEGPK